MKFKVGIKIKSRIERGTKNEFYVLTLDRIEGIHYIFKNKYGWLQAFTLPQLCFNVEHGYIKILKDKGEDKNVKN